MKTKAIMLALVLVMLVTPQAHASERYPSDACPAWGYSTDKLNVQTSWFGKHKGRLKIIFDMPSVEKWPALNEVWVQSNSENDPFFWKRKIRKPNDKTKSVFNMPKGYKRWARQDGNKHDVSVTLWCWDDIEHTTKRFGGQWRMCINC